MHLLLCRLPSNTHDGQRVAFFDWLLHLPRQTFQGVTCYKIHSGPAVLPTRSPGTNDGFFVGQLGIAIATVNPRIRIINRKPGREIFSQSSLVGSGFLGPVCVAVVVEAPKVLWAWCRLQHLETKHLNTPFDRTEVSPDQKRAYHWP